MLISFDRLDGTYFRDILAQPQAMRDTIAAFVPVPALAAVGDDLRSGRRRRIVLTGMGGSYQILHPLHLSLTGLGLNSILVETSELLYGMPALLAPENIVLAVSQSGASAEIVRLLDHRGPLYIGISNTAGSPLATRASTVMLTQAGDEGGVSCKTAVTSLAALHWLFAHLAGTDLTLARQELETLPQAMEAYLAGWRDHVTHLVAAMQGVRNLFIVGRGSSMAAVGLGAMVQKEAAHVQGEGMGSAALRHGPFEMLGPGSFVLIFDGAANVHALHQRLAEDVRGTGAMAEICGLSGRGPFALPPVPDALRPVVELLVPQMMSLALAYLGGREPGKFERIKKVTTGE